jgi:hypothetical protein
MLTQLFSPAVFCGLLAALLGLQFALSRAIHAALNRQPPAQVQQSVWVKAYRLLLPAVSDANLRLRSSPAAAGVWLHPPNTVMWSGLTSLEARRTTSASQQLQ